MSTSNKKAVGYGEALCGSRYWRATWFCMLSAVFNQACGVNAVNIYSTTLFKQIGVSVELGSIIVGVSQFIGVIGGGLFMKCGLGFRKMYIIA